MAKLGPVGEEGGVVVLLVWVEIWELVTVGGEGGGFPGGLGGVGFLLGGKGEGP